MVVTMFAILHELPDRGSFSEDLVKFLSPFILRDFPVLVIAREPCMPSELQKQKFVYLSADCSPLLLEQLASRIQNAHPLFFIGSKPKALAEAVRMSPRLAVETIVKLFYLKSFDYELKERITSFSDQEFLTAFRRVFATNNIRHKNLQSDSFDRYWTRLGLRLTDEEIRELPKPQLHIQIIAKWFPEEMKEIPTVAKEQEIEERIPCDPIAFYSGGLAKNADIIANLDVPRTQYIKSWTDEKGVLQNAWKDKLLAQAKRTLSKKKFCIVVVYGHRGSGKTTLCKRMMHDLNDSSIPIVDLLTETLSPEHKSDETIWFLFRRKAKRGLLTSLIEATRGTEEEQNLVDILWYEFQSLSDKAKCAYGFVTLFSAFGVAVPYSVMEKALLKLTGDQAYFESDTFSNETAEIIYRPKTVSYSSRNRLVADTLLQRFRNDFKYRLLRVMLTSLDLSIPSHRTFFEIITYRKVFQVLTDIEVLIQDIKEGIICHIPDPDICKVLNSILRICQGQGKYQKGKQLAEESLKIWNHARNPAIYLRAYCCYYLGETDEVRKVAIEIAKGTYSPLYILHAAILFHMLREWSEADKALRSFKESVGNDVVLYSEYNKLRPEVNLWLSVSWSDTDIDSLRPSMALEKIESMLVDGGADERTIIDQYKRLIRRQHGFFKGYLSFFCYLHQLLIEDNEDILLERYKVLQCECEYHLGQHEDQYRKYPNDVLSLLYSNLARALFKIDFILKNGYQRRETCNQHFQKAISLKKDNWYAYNWYGTFLKEVIEDRKKCSVAL